MSTVPNHTSTPPNAMVTIDGQFWITHLQPNHPVSASQCRLYRSNVSWRPHDFNESGIVVAVQENAEVAIEEGKAYRMSGNLNFDSDSMVSILNIVTGSIRPIQPCDFKSENASGPIEVLSTGVIIEAQPEPIFFDAIVLYRIVKLQGDRLSARVLYRIPEAVYKSGIDNLSENGTLIKLKGVLTGFDDFERSWVVEVLYAESMGRSYGGQIARGEYGSGGNELT